MTSESNFAPEEKQPGNLILARDWNAAMSEIRRLGLEMNNRVNTAGDTVGWLRVSSRLQVDGELTAQDSLLVSGHLTVQAELRVSERVEMQQALNVAGPLTAGTDLIVNGNIGIGTASPGSRLDIHAASDNGGDSVLNDPEPMLTLNRPGVLDESWPNIAKFSLGRFEKNGDYARTRLDLSLNHGPGTEVTDIMTWCSNGNVGIGTSEPQVSLHVQSEAPVVRVESPAENGNAALQLREHRDSGFDIRYDGTANQLQFTGMKESEPDGAQLVFQRENGRVGIGTTDPRSALDVGGDIAVNDNLIWLRRGTDANHGLGYYGLKDQGDDLFAETDIDGPVLFGFRGGALGSTRGGQKIALTWDEKGDVRISNWLSMGPGGDVGRVWVGYRSEKPFAPQLVLSDKDDPPSIVFQQVGNGSEEEPQYRSWIGQSDNNTNNITISTNHCTVSGSFAARTKQFRINHPLRAGYDLIHACLEGPENGVYYRGTARLRDGRATVQLPHYFEALTRPEDRTVQLTPLGPEPFLLSYTPVVDGQFMVYGSHPEGAFAWHVCAARADVPPLDVEVEKKD